jgi:hypothetical protein
MGGYFIDSIIRSLAKSVRGKRRVQSALSWPTVSGKITILSQGHILGDRLRLRLVFSYEINGETYYGGAIATSIEPKQINQMTDSINSIGIIHVRYDPADPESSQLLNQDNPGIPFEIDHAAI